MTWNKFISANSSLTQSRATTDDLLQHGAREQVVTEVYRRQCGTTQPSGHVPPAIAVKYITMYRKLEGDTLKLT